MPSRRRCLLLCAALLWGCSGQPPEPDRTPVGEPASSEIMVRAVDATTGADLTDAALTIRYLARAPITLDATGVEEVPSNEPYHIVHAVAEDSMILELRLEAPSYYKLDTVVSVARGATAGPYRLAMAPRSGRAAGGRPAASPSGGQPSGGGGARPAAPAAEDRSTMMAGDRAFQNGDWRGAAREYLRMPEPRDRGGDYAREYQMALVRLGITFINLGDWQGAHDALQEAVAFDFREYTAFFYLGQVQCVLGQYPAGRQSLNHIREWLSMYISEGQQPIVLALLDFQLGMCSYGEYSQARLQGDMERARQQAVQEFQSFLDQANAFPTMPPEIQAAAGEARRIMGEIRRQEPETER